MSINHVYALFWSRFKRLLRYGVTLLLAGSVVSVLLFKFLPVPVSAFMIHRHIDDWVADRHYQTIAYRWVDNTNISRHAITAVIAAEDQLFYQHNGFDFAAISAAVDDYRDGGRLRGASTISQQVAKNLFLSPAKSFWRKGFEIWLTCLLEVFWSKTRILEVYLNIAEFGDHLFGIEAASQHYFGISAKQLSAAQAALLAATLPNPLRFHANQPSRYVLRRQSWILKQMHNLGELHEP